MPTVSSHTKIVQFVVKFSKIQHTHKNCLSGYNPAADGAVVTVIQL